MGELHNHLLEWRSLITDQLIDFIRAHVSQIGGLSPARSSPHSVRRTGSVPPGTGRRRLTGRPRRQPPPRPRMPQLRHPGSDRFSDKLREVFPGIPELRDGYLWPNGRPGLGIEIDEKLAARFPIEVKPIEWTQSRWPDGTLWTP